MNGLWIILIVLIVAAVYAVSVYNGLIVLKNRVDEAWSDIEVQMKRRYDLIPNLVETVKGYAAHESGTLEKVIQARNMAMAAHGGVKETAESENILTGTLKSLFALTENYPDLKANENFLNLQAQLEGTENRIATERKRYTEAVAEFNTSIKKFPTNIYAGWFGFKEKPQFKAEAGAEKAPEVKF